jgi:hypothetical protein
MLILDIPCQQLGDECKLKGFCVPFGHRVGNRAVEVPKKKAVKKAPLTGASGAF